MAAYARAPDAVLTRRGERAFLTRLDTGDVFETNATGAMVFQAAAAGGSPQDVAAELSRAFPAVPAEEIALDVEDV
ncbi:MAG TPA: PqqD family peptide modification chaperone, partial [Candidatus Thermoplasmatota archaeon]|nr:PqqD family peptide modification chaperone [Candidatus Thermoplasmatota archaeon]